VALVSSQQKEVNQGVRRDLHPGTRVGEYVLVAPLGEGGFATVWSAHHHMWPDRKVAAKILHRSDRRELLQSEADCLIRLKHERIANAVGMDLDHDPPYLLLDLHEGRTLREVLQATRLSPDRVLGLFRQLAEAVAHAHERGVAHGDLKPENVLVNNEGVLKLTDFGLGNQLTTEASLMLSGKLESGEAPPGLAGTIPYMAPEQREGQPPDSASDVFSLGIILHEMLTGSRPQPGDDPREHLSNPPPWLGVWARCWTRRDRRLKDAAQILSALDAAISGEPPEVLVRPRTDEASERPTARRRIEVERDRHRLVITNDSIESGTWSLEQIELVVAQESGVRVGSLRQIQPERNAMGKLMTWAEDHLLGEEREIYQARAMVWFLAHEFRRDSIEDLAARYGVQPRTVDAGIRSVRRRRVQKSVWRGVVQRLVSLPQPLAEDAGDLESSPAHKVTAGLALGFAAVMLIPALALVASGNLVFGLLLLGLASTSAFGAGRILTPNDTQEEWIESHLEQVPGQDRRAKLAHLAIQTEFTGLSRAARHMLEREPIQMSIRAKIPPAIAAPTITAEPRRREAQPPRREAPAPQVTAPEPAPQLKAPKPTPQLAAPPEKLAAPVPEPVSPAPPPRDSLDDMIRDRAAAAREAAPEPTPEVSEPRSSLDDMIRQRANAARERVETEAHSTPEPEEAGPRRIAEPS
jgi:serine/threonine protein kinase